MAPVSTTRSPLHHRVRARLRALPPGARLAAGFVAFNLLLFIPYYVVYSYENDFWPFFPPGHPRGAYDWGWPGLGRSLYEYAMQLVVRRHNKDIFRISADWVLIVSSVMVLGRCAGRWRPATLTLAWIAYLVLLVFTTYSALMEHLLGRPAALVDDVLLLESAWIFLGDTWSLVEVLYGAAALAGLVGLGTLLARYLTAVWRWAAGLERRHAIAGWAVANAYCVLSLAWFGIDRDDPIVQLRAKEVHANVERSRRVLATVEALTQVSALAATRFADTVPARRPDIFLFEVESYGAAFWADDDYRAARQGLMRRVDRGLDELGLTSVTRFAAAPVYGGGSWMSKASALSGIRIASHSAYLAWKRMARRHPHLVAYLNRHGYYTLALQPASLWSEGIYGYDDVVVRGDLQYDGPYYGFGHIPDQWSLDRTFTTYWRQRPRPRLFHFSTVSTHFAWEAPPRLTDDIAELEVPQPSFIETQPAYVELALTVPQGRKRDYFVTIAYEWELLLDAFRRHVEPGFIALVYGDHQPPFIAGERGDRDVALHVITDIPDLHAPLRQAGFTPGGNRPWTPGAADDFRIEALYSFVLSLLATEDGAPLQYEPTGMVLPDAPGW